MNYKLFWYLDEKSQYLTCTVSKTSKSIPSFSFLYLLTGQKMFNQCLLIG